ncbi:MAG: hypothetical protein E6G08_05875 [Actinobacteria bacterium]|nr:MAG: hypothetical protein E6G08_05875 [Actinomycetota bacterium]
MAAAPGASSSAQSVPSPRSRTPACGSSGPDSTAAGAFGAVTAASRGTRRRHGS